MLACWFRYGIFSENITFPRTPIHSSVSTELWKTHQNLDEFQVVIQFMKSLFYSELISYFHFKISQSCIHKSIILLCCWIQIKAEERIILDAVQIHPWTVHTNSSLHLQACGHVVNEQTFSIGVPKKQLYINYLNVDILCDNSRVWV